MLWPLFALVGALAGLGVVGGVIKGTIDTVKHNRSNKINNTTTKETKAKKRKAKKEKTETVEEEQEKVVNETTKDVKQWLKKNKLSDEELNALVQQRVDQICKNEFTSSEVEKECKPKLEKVLTDVCRRIIQLTEERNIVAIPSLRDFILKDEKSFNVVKNIFDKYKEYDVFVTKLASIKKERDEALQNYKMLTGNVDIREAKAKYETYFAGYEYAESKLKSIKSQLISDKIDSAVFKSNVDTAISAIEDEIKRIDEVKKQDIKIGNVEKKANINSKKINKLEDLKEMVESHDYDLKMLGYLGLADLQDQISNLRNGVNDFGQETSERLSKLETEVNETVASKLKKFEERLLTLARTKSNSAKVRGLDGKVTKIEKLVENIEKVLKDKCESNEVADLLQEVKSMRETIKEHTADESIHSTLSADLEELEKVVTKKLVKTVTEEVVKKSTTKVEKLNTQAKKQLIAEVIAKVREALKEDISAAINIKDLTDSVIDNIEVTNKR